MSRALVDLIFSRRCGSAARKAVLLAMADRANDDGSGVWVSKSRIAAETEWARSTIISAMRALEAEGVIRAIGKKAGNHGYTVVYHMSVAKLAALPTAWGKCSNPDTLDGDLGNERSEDGEVSDHATLEAIQVPATPTLKRFQVSESTSLSVRPTDKNQSFIEPIDKPSDSKKTKTPPIRTASFVLWEAQREKNPAKADALFAEAEALADAERENEKRKNTKEELRP